MMTTFKPTLGDVEASTDILRDVQDISDTLTAEEAVEFRVVVEHVLQACKVTLDLLNSQIVSVLEQDVVRDGRRFYVGRKKDSERFDHDAICGAVIRAAVEEVEEGENNNAYDAAVATAGAREAVHLMRTLYVSDSTKAKVGVLDRLGIPRDRDAPGSVRSWTPGDRIVVDIPAGGER